MFDSWPLVILVVLAAFGPLAVFGLVRSARRRTVEELIATGRTIDARVVGFRREPLYRYSSGSSGLYNRTVLRVLAEASVGGRRRTFRSERIYKDKCGLVQGDSVAVRIRADNPAKYYFDPYQAAY